MTTQLPPPGVMVGIFPAPPGVTPTFHTPSIELAREAIMHTILLAAATVFFIVRLYTRGIVKKRLNTDDYMLMVSWVLMITFSVILIISTTKGGRRHIWDLTLQQFRDTMKFLFIAELSYLPLAVTLRLSILFCYLHIFGREKRARWLVYIGMGFVVAFYTAMIFYTIFICKPVRKAWDPLVPGKCADVGASPIGSGVFNVLSDFYILLLPVPFTWSLQMKTSRKLRVLAVFGTGLFICATSIVRLVITKKYAYDADVTYNFGRQSIWAVLEVTVGFIVSCTLALPAFLEHIKQNPTVSSFFSKLSSSFSTSRGSGSGSGIESKKIDSMRLPSHHSRTNGTMHSKSGYTELDVYADTTRLKDSRSDAQPGSDYYSRVSVKAASRSNEDVEALPKGAGIVKTVDIHHAYPAQTYSPHPPSRG